MESLYTGKTYESCVNRINQLSSDSQRQWGKMSASQMVEHCARVQEAMNGETNAKPNWFVKTFLLGMIKNIVFSEKPFKKNGQTDSSYVVKQEGDLNEQRTRLLSAMERFHKSEQSNFNHSFFGELTPEQRGWASYKHLNHHLDQFGV